MSEKHIHWTGVLPLVVVFLGLLMLPFTCSRGALVDDSDISSGSLWNASGNGLDSVKRVWNTLTFRGMHDSAIGLVHPLLNDAVKSGDTMTVLFAGASIAQSYLMMEDADSTRYYLSMLDPYMPANTDPMLGVFVNNIAGSYSLKYDLDYRNALQSFELAYEWARKGGDVGNQIVMLANIVNIFYVRSDRAGMKYAERALALSVGPGASGYARSLASVSMAQMAYLSEDYDGTFRYLSEALRLSSKADIEVVMPVIYLLYADTYSVKGEDDKAVSYYEKAISVSSVAEPAVLSKIYMNYGSWCESRKDYAKAVELYRTGLDLSYRYRNMEFRRELLNRLSDLQYLMGNKEASLDYYRQYRDHLDSISSADKEQEFNALLVSFREMEHKAEVQQKELALLKARKRSLYIGAAFLFIAVVLVFLWIIYRRQQKMYRALVVQHQNYMQQLDSEAAAGEAIPDTPDGSSHTADGSDASRVLFQRLEELVRNKKIYSQKDLSLDKIAEMLGSNRTYVSKAINDVAGTSYYNYIDAFRIREATRIISESDDDVPFKQLSDDLGYNSISVFYKAFRNATGCTPGQYRTQIKQIRKEQQG